MSTSPPYKSVRQGAKSRWIAVLLILGGAACDSSREEQLAALSSPEGPVRAQAIAELGKKGDDENLGDIMAHVGDPDVLVRSSVASALGNYDVQKASDALGELAADPAEPVQVLAARSLARLKIPRAHSYLLLAYRRDGSAVRAAVVEGLEKSGGAPADAVKAEAKATWEQLSSALTKGGAAERVGAAEELGRSGRPEAVERLVPYLGADSRALAQAAALGLGESGLPQAREPLEAMLNDPDPDLQMAALQGLETLASPDSGPALVKTALKGGRVGRAALELLAGLPGDGSGFCAVTLVGDQEIAGRAGELAALRHQTCDEAPLFAKLSRGAPAEAAALAALAGLGRQPTAPTPDQAQRIVSLLASGPPEVRPLAARAAGALHVDAAAPALHKAMDEGKGHLQSGRQRWVKEALPEQYAPGYEPKGSIGGEYKAREEKLMAKLAAQGARVDDTGEEPVGPLFGDDTSLDAALFAESARAAIALGAADSADLEKSLAQDPSALVRQVACQAATLLPPAAGWELLKGLAGDADPAVRSEALQLLPDVLAKAAPTERSDGAGSAGAGAEAEGRSIRSDAENFLAKALANADGVADDVLIADIGKLGGAPVTPAVLASLKAALERPGTASQAARALGQLATPEAKTTLLDRLHREASAGLPDIIAALGRLKVADAVPPIRSLLFHVSPSVRSAAAQVLVAMDDPQGKREAEALREDYYAMVRHAAGASAKPVTSGAAAASK
jgi:HEAT repeat protein